MSQYAEFIDFGNENESLCDECLESCYQRWYPAETVEQDGQECVDECKNGVCYDG